MRIDDKQQVVEWLDSTVAVVSKSDPELLKEFVLELLEEVPGDKERDEFIETVCSLLDQIVRDKEVFAQELYDVVVAGQKHREDSDNWVTIYDIPQDLCKRKLVLKEFEQFGVVCGFKLTGSLSQPRRNALIKFEDSDAVNACLQSTIPFFNDRFVQVDTVVAVEPAKLPKSTPFSQMTTQLNVKSKQLAQYRERLREIENRIEATNPNDSCNVRHCQNLYREFLEELDRKQLSPELLYRLQDKLQAIKYDPKTYVKPRRPSGERVRVRD